MTEQGTGGRDRNQGTEIVAIAVEVVRREREVEAGEQVYAFLGWVLIASRYSPQFSARKYLF